MTFLQAKMRVGVMLELNESHGQFISNFCFSKEIDAKKIL